MDIKNYLKQYEYAESEARRLEEEYKAQQEKVDAIQSSLGGDGVPAKGADYDRVQELAVELASKATELAEAQLEALRKRQRIYETISSLDGKYADVLYARYIEFKTWGQVARSVSYSRSQAFEIHNEALRILEKKKSPD